MKKINFIFFVFVTVFLFRGVAVYSQVAINSDGTAPDASAMLDVKSTDKGILIPRVNGTGSITTPVKGLLIYSTSDDSFYYYDGSAWKKLETSGGSQWIPSGSDIYYNSGGVAIGAASVNSSALLDLTSASKGILIPRMSEMDRLSISNPEQGLLVYQNESSTLPEGFYYYSNNWYYIHNSTNGILQVDQGGTGLSNIVSGNIPYGSSSTALAQSSNLSFKNSILYIKGTLQVNGGKINTVSSVSSTTTLNNQDIVLCNGGSITLYLPTVSGNSGRTYTIKNIGTSDVIIDPNGSESIEGNPTYGLTSNKSIVITTDGTAWYIIAGY